MKEKSRKGHSYVLSLAASALVVLSAWGTGIVREGTYGITLYLPQTIDAVYAVSDHSDAERAYVQKQPSEETEKPPVTAEAEAPEQFEQEPAMYEAEPSYFDDALFIGDSRTVGLHEYGNLGGAEVLADSGMNVYRVFEKEFATVTGERKSLETVLSERQFGKIYVMLGINELGCDYDQTVNRYQTLIERLEELQPEAKLFLQANLHITAKKSETSPIYTNENIDRFNRAVEEMTDNRTRFYLDINELFDDENGCLSETYTVDNAHVRGKYYEEWTGWILKHAR